MNPLKAIMTVRRDELPLVASMFVQFFCIITAFWIFKPLKKSLFLQYYDQGSFDFLGLTFNAAQAELLAKILNLALAILALAAFSFLSKYFKREKLSYIFTSLMLVIISIFALNLNNPGPILVWSFYLFGDLYNTILVVTFFAFLNDIVTPEQSRRIYGPTLLGGVVGGVVATTWVKLYLKTLSLSQWMIASFIITSVILLTSYITSRQQKVIVPQSNKAGSNLQIGNFLRTLPQQKYLMCLISMVGLYEMVSTVMDFQFSSVVSHYLNGDAIGEHISLVFSVVNWTSLLVQLILTTIILSRFGVGAAIAVLPLAVLGASAFYIVFPILWIASLMPIFDNALRYSIYQSSYESLYVPLPQDQIYQAKSFIDIFIMRGAKVLAIGLSLGISMTFTSFESIRWLSIITIVLVAAWLWAIFTAVREYRLKTQA